MNEVEELCDRLLMIDHGREVLYGSLSEIKSGYKSNTVYLEYTGELGELRGATLKAARKGYAELELNGADPDKLLYGLVNRGLSISRFELAVPSLNEIFLKVAGAK